MPPLVAENGSDYIGSVRSSLMVSDGLQEEFSNVPGCNGCSDWGMMSGFPPAALGDGSRARCLRQDPLGAQRCSWVVDDPQGRVRRQKMTGGGLLLKNAGRKVQRRSRGLDYSSLRLV